MHLEAIGIIPQLLHQKVKLLACFQEQMDAVFTFYILFLRSERTTNSSSPLIISIFHNKYKKKLLGIGVPGLSVFCFVFKG